MITILSPLSRIYVTRSLALYVGHIPTPLRLYERLIRWTAMLQIFFRVNGKLSNLCNLVKYCFCCDKIEMFLCHWFLN